MGITEEYLENLPIGSKVEFENKYGTEKVAIKFCKDCFKTIGKDSEIWHAKEIFNAMAITKIEIPSYTTEYASVLDDTEREYLSNIIKPFRDKVVYIQKGVQRDYREINNEYLTIRVYGIEEINEDIDLPLFKGNTMYRGMKVDKKYTLEGLGL